MRIKTVLAVQSLICFIVSFAMIPCVFVSVQDGTYDRAAFLFSISAGVILSFLMILPMFMAGEKFSDSIKKIGIREGIGVTGFTWIFASSIGALPYYFANVVNSYVDAFFETMSGFTTTGATILAEIQSAPRGILLWRSLTHWMGGMGIIVLSLAVLPFLGLRGIELYKAEVPGVNAEKVTPRLQQTAKRLWLLYIFLTFSETALLMLGGMNFFDAFNHSCATIATGGFSTKNDSIAYFQSPYIEWVIIIFMFLSGVNFSLYFLLFAKNFTEFYKDEEFKLYLKIIAVCSIAITIKLYFSGFGFMFREALFHVISIMTTTGFVSQDYNAWPEFAKFIFVLLMFTGASGGSTGGGFKISRIIILGRKLRTEFTKLLHPRAVIVPRLNERPLNDNTMNATIAFFILFMLLVGVGTLITTACDVDILTALTGVLTCLSNVGPGLNFLGPVDNFSALPALVKWLFALLMLAGRLELFAVALLVYPGTYKK